MKARVELEGGVKLQDLRAFSPRRSNYVIHLLQYLSLCARRHFPPADIFHGVNGELAFGSANQYLVREVRVFLNQNSRAYELIEFRGSKDFFLVSK